MSPVLPRSGRPAGPARTAGGVLALSLALAGCGAGFKAETYQERTAADTTNAAIGDLTINDLHVLAPPVQRSDAQPDGQPAYPVGSNARVTFVATNEGVGDDQLVNVTTDAARAVAPLGTSGTGGDIRLGGYASSQRFYLELRSLTRTLRPAEYISMTLTWARAGSKTLLVPVRVAYDPAPRVPYEVPDVDSNGSPLPLPSETAGAGQLGNTGQQGSGGAGVGPSVPVAPAQSPAIVVSK